MIDRAFILAAGRGTRMRPLTERMPKPMVELGGRSLIDRALDHLTEAGVRRVVVNTHHRAEVLEAHLAARTTPQIMISREEELLDTGGGIARAVHHFGGLDFFVVSGDALWEGPALADLAAAWDPARMDILVLLQPLAAMAATRGVGDYRLAPDSRAVRARDRSGTHMFTSLRINRAAVFDAAPGAPFSYLDLLDAAQAAGRLFGLEHAGAWHHVSTPADVAAVEGVLA